MPVKLSSYEGIANFNVRKSSSDLPFVLFAAKPSDWFVIDGVTGVNTYPAGERMERFLHKSSADYTGFNMFMRNVEIANLVHGVSFNSGPGELWLVDNYIHDNIPAVGEVDGHTNGFFGGSSKRAMILTNRWDNNLSLIHI